ncbi:MarR family transcriptional regulator [Kineococcus aurantiacus]|uniref:DNA-binding MarR family transcriptional regulator n=1 Tax=Kineococcus aurantiacus TaxID=37633 RepID=A0A7Y9J2G9_9ACTN|nr:DNA-binding MarR family transcriptional regulator [Kineococcus aurantiacus]NYD25071.1 DNA-binding MarR family transcriptional regulator [Kineococcus aurantiacus]
MLTTPSAHPTDAAGVDPDQGSAELHPVPVDRLPGVREELDVIARSPFSGSELGHLTLQAGLGVLGILDSAADRVGLLASDLRAMYLLQVLGDQSAGSLARHMLVPQSCVTLIAKRLQEEGLVTRAKDPHDGRKVILGITGAGRCRLDEASVLVRAELRTFFAPLSPASAVALAALLADVVEPGTSGAGQGR